MSDDRYSVTLEERSGGPGGVARTRFSLADTLALYAEARRIALATLAGDEVERQRGRAVFAAALDPASPDRARSKLFAECIRRALTDVQTEMMAKHAGLQARAVDTQATGAWQQPGQAGPAYGGGGGGAGGAPHAAVGGAQGWGSSQAGNVQGTPFGHASAPHAGGGATSQAAGGGPAGAVQPTTAGWARQHSGDIVDPAAARAAAAIAAAAGVPLTSMPDSPAARARAERAAVAGVSSDVVIGPPQVVDGGTT